MSYAANMRDEQQTPLYDTYSAAAAAAIPNKITFFDVAQSGSKGPELTNMKKANELPFPEKFTVFGLSLVPLGMDELDILKLMKQYTAVFIVGDKTYARAPMEFFPNIGGLAGFAATTATATTIKQVTNGVPIGPNGAFAMGPEYGVTIESGDHFEVNLVGTTGFTATAAIFLRAYLIGVYAKGVQ